VSGGHTANLVYDPLGRLQQIDNGAGTTTRFVYDGDALVDEYDGSGNLTRRDQTRARKFPLGTPQRASTWALPRPRLLAS
jgi:hypothetical protein